jgi:DNA polymerase III epsilon subunit-like protein
LQVLTGSSIFTPLRDCRNRKELLYERQNQEKFLKTHTSIHGISYEDVEFSLNFQELWEDELSKYLSSNLLIFHNASMDLSVLKNLSDSPQTHLIFLVY